MRENVENALNEVRPSMQADGGNAELVDVHSTPDMSYQQALIIAMQREKASFNLYNNLEAIADDEDLRSTFLALAQGEAKHKLRLETIYDERILTEN